MIMLFFNIHQCVTSMANACSVHKGLSDLTVATDHSYTPGITHKKMTLCHQVKGNDTVLYSTFMHSC